MGTAFFVIWYSSLAITLALDLAGLYSAAFPFAMFCVFCTGLSLGWKRAERRKGGDGK